MSEREAVIRKLWRERKEMILGELELTADSYQEADGATALFCLEMKISQSVILCSVVCEGIRLVQGPLV